MSEDIITKIKVDTIYSDEVGMYVAEFHYRFKKELEMGIDHSTGEPCEVYGKVAIEYMNPVPQEQLKSWHESRAVLKDSLSYMSSDEIKDALPYIIPISREEYEKNVS